LSLEEAVEMAEKGPTVFGWVVVELMMSRGITTHTGLSARMQEPAGAR
jgi:hypothetical protein